MESSSLKLKQQKKSDTLLSFDKCLICQKKLPDNHELSRESLRSHDVINMLINFPIKLLFSVETYVILLKNSIVDF